MVLRLTRVTAHVTIRTMLPGPGQADGRREHPDGEAAVETSDPPAPTADADGTVATPSDPAHVRTVIAGTDEARCDALRGALQGAPGVQVLAVTSDPATTALQAARSLADVVVLADGCERWTGEICSRLAELARRPHTLLVDAEGDEATLLAAMEAGVDGYAVDGATGAGLPEAIRALARGESVMPRVMLGPLLRYLIEQRREAAAAADQLVALTPREREVLAQLVGGHDHNDMAAELFISPETARTHIQRVLRKLGVHSRAEAIELVHRTGMAERLERLIERSAS
jgi:DNA-binding NarL/FixJ family response regulator